MKHWKRILAAALSVILLCGVCFAVSGISAPRANAANGDTVSPQSEPSFTDVPAEAWYADAVGWCRENGIMSGTSGTTFAPEASMTRAMMVTVLHRAAGTPASTGENVFTDNVPGSWSYDAVVWAAANNILAGYGDGRFGSNDPVTREQAAVILHRYAGNPDAGTTVIAADASAISSYAVDAVTWASADGLLRTDDSGHINPKSNAARAEVAYMLYQHLGNSNVPAPAPSGDTSQVFMTTDISPEGLMAVYKALEWTPTGNVAVKLSTGEPPASNYLDPALIADVVHEVNGTIVECNTAYGGSRTNTAMYYQVIARNSGDQLSDGMVEHALWLGAWLCDYMDTFSTGEVETETMNHKGSTHFTWEQRLTLERMLKKGFSKPKIADALGKCERSIYYEINRGLCEQITTDLEKVWRCSPEQAERKYREYLKETGPELKIGNDHALVRRLEELIVEQHFSPGAALA